MFKNPLLHSTMFFEKDWFVKIGMYPEKRLAQDYFIWCQAILKNKLKIIHKPLVKWRISSESLTKTEGNLQTVFCIHVNEWYLNQITSYQMPKCAAGILFGSFRYSQVHRESIKNIRKTLEILLTLNSQFENIKGFKQIRNDLLYQIIAIHINKIKDLLLINFILIKHDYKIIFSRLPYKLLVKFLLTAVLLKKIRFKSEIISRP